MEEKNKELSNPYNNTKNSEIIYTTYAFVRILIRILI